MEKVTSTGNSQVRSDLTYNYQELVNAVITLSANDYRSLARRLKASRAKLRDLQIGSTKYEKIIKEIRSIRGDMASIERFFRSSQWLELVHVDGTAILNMLKAEFVQD